MSLTYKRIIAKSNIDREIKGQFKEEKLKLKEKRYPAAETIEMVGRYYAIARGSIVKEIQPNSVLLVTPSSSGINNISRVFANMIARETNCVVIADTARPVHNFEAKKRLTIYGRSEEVIDFEILNPAELKARTKGKEVYIVEDWAATGESCINFRKRLQNNGIEVKDIVALIASSKYYCTGEQIKYAGETLCKGLPKDMHRDAQKYVGQYLSGYLQGKFTRLRSALIQPGKEMQIYNTLKRTIENYHLRGLLTDRKNDNPLNLGF